MFARERLPFIIYAKIISSPAWLGCDRSIARGILLYEGRALRAKLRGHLDPPRRDLPGPRERRAEGD